MAGERNMARNLLGGSIRKMHQQESGFSYIETLFAIFILGIGSLALAQLFAAGVQINARTKDETEVATIAQKYLERLYQQGYDDLSTGVGGDLTVPTTDFSVMNVKLEDSGTVSNQSQFHQNEVRYDIYWRVAHCGNANPADVCTNAQKIAGKNWIEISVRVVDQRIRMGARGREVTVRAQISDII
jgi:type II secretory pathway pseudopilin PulG